MFVLLLFFASGATALVYEVLWSKYLTIMLGSTVQAQTVVLAVFMGGLAIGNRLFGRLSITIKNPLLGYGVMEILIGIYALLFPNIYRAADWIFVATGSNFATASFALLLLKLFISVALLIIPTVLMGGTLPLIAAWIEKQPGFESGARVGIFYAVNSLGAVTGAGLAGFYLIQEFGMTGTLAFAATANVLIGLGAGFIAKRQQTELVTPKKGANAASTAFAMEAPPAPSWFAMLVALTGGVSMGLEVLSARSLALIAGGSLQAFALVLMSFILGIGLGSMIISSSKAAKRYGIHTIYALLLVAASMRRPNTGLRRIRLAISGIACFWRFSPFLFSGCRRRAWAASCLCPSACCKARPPVWATRSADCSPQIRLALSSEFWSPDLY
jgi:spermidine synthase